MHMNAVCVTKNFCALLAFTEAFKPLIQTLHLCGDQLLAYGYVQALLIA